MNERKEQIETIELSIEAAKKHIEDGAALMRLHNNPDFRRIFMDGYFKDEAIRIVMVKSDPNMQEVEQQKFCDNIILGIGMLRQYFSKIINRANDAQAALEEDKQTREELIAEDALLDKEVPFTEASTLQ